MFQQDEIAYFPESKFRKSDIYWTGNRLFQQSLLVR